MRRLGCVVIIAWGAAAWAGEIRSSFDSDAEGWDILNDAIGFVWDGAMGNPAGAIRARDASDGRIWYFSGSTSYVGNLGSFYGGLLSWDLLGISGNHASVTGRADIMLAGSAGAIGIDIPVLAVNGQWTSWQVSLLAGDWHMVSSTSNGSLSATLADEATMRAVLGNLTGFYIQGEYTSGGDAMALDNVVLVPAPAATMLFAGAALLGRRRRG